MSGEWGVRNFNKIKRKGLFGNKKHLLTIYLPDFNVK